MSENINIEINGEQIPVVEIKVDENSAQAAKDAAAAAQLVLDEIQSGNFAGFLPKADYPGTATDLDNSIKSIQYPDMVTKAGTVSEVYGTISIPANGFEWRINQIEYVDVNGYSVVVPAAQDGYYRTDLIVGNTSGGFTKITGVENSTIAVKPPLLPNTVEITFITVFGTVITGVQPAVSGSQYVMKVESNGYLIMESGVNVFAKIPPDGRKLIIFNNPALVSISGFDLYGVQNNTQANKPYQGAIFRLSNETGVDVILKHNASFTGQKMPFNLKGGVDLIFPSKGHITVHYNYGNSIELNEEFKSWDTTLQDLTPYEKITDNDAKLLLKANQSTTYTKTETDALDATILANGKTYSDGLITQLINGAPADGNTLKELNDKILAVQAIIGGTTADGDAIVNTIKELLAVFATFPEGVDLVTLLAGKVNTTDVYNALDSIVAGKVLDARQGKVLNDLIASANAEIATKEPTITGGLVTTFFSGLKTFRNLATDVLAVVLGTYIKGAGTVSSTDTIKGAIQKLDGNIDAKASKLGTRTVLTGNAIDWSTDTDTYTKTLTANTTLTDSNLPQGTNTKTIVLSIDGAFTLTVPAYWKLKGGTYSATKVNQIVLQCVNGNTGSERVNYIINPDL